MFIGRDTDEQVEFLSTQLRLGRITVEIVEVFAHCGFEPAIRLQGEKLSVTKLGNDETVRRLKEHFRYFYGATEFPTQEFILWLLNFQHWGDDVAALAYFYAVRAATEVLKTALPSANSRVMEYQICVESLANPEFDARTAIIRLRDSNRYQHENSNARRRLLLDQPTPIRFAYYAICNAVGTHLGNTKNNDQLHETISVCPEIAILACLSCNSESRVRYHINTSLFEHYLNGL